MKRRKVGKSQHELTSALAGIPSPRSSQLNDRHLSAFAQDTLISASLAARNFVSYYLSGVLLLYYEVVRLVNMALTRWWRPVAVENDGLETKQKKAKVKRRRAKSTTPSVSETGHFPGMVNLSGTLCYMNSVLQVGFLQAKRIELNLPGFRFSCGSPVTSRTDCRFGGRSGLADTGDGCTAGGDDG